MRILNAKYSRTELFSMILGSALLSLPLIPLVASAQTRSINPCPQIYYEEPFNSSRAVPQGCPPNAATQEQSGQSGTPIAPAPLPSNPASNPTPTTPPLPETQQPVVANVTPVNGAVNVRLVNDVGTSVTYQVIGNTEQRNLPAGQSVFLRSLPAPINITFVRPDGGFVIISPTAAATPGELDVRLSAAPTVDNSQSTLNVQQDGSVLLN